MTRIRIPSLLCIALLASASALAAGIPDLRASSLTVSGIYSLTFNLNIASALPAETTITCRAQIVPNPQTVPDQGGFDPGNRQLSAIPVRTVTGRAFVTGSTAICAAEIPFSWTGMSARGGAVLSYEIDAVNGSGSIPLLIRTTGQQNIGVAFPASGGSARLNFNLNF
jgi:hypothetical protein